MKALSLIAAALVLASCHQPQVSAQSEGSVTAKGDYGNFVVTKIQMHDGTACYVATESGHGIAMQCFQKPGQQ
jgi:hypothetical protein